MVLEGSCCCCCSSHGVLGAVRSPAYGPLAEQQTAVWRLLTADCWTVEAQQQLPVNLAACGCGSGGRPAGWLPIGWPGAGGWASQTTSLVHPLSLSPYGDPDSDNHCHCMESSTSSSPSG